MKKLFLFVFLLTILANTNAQTCLWAKTGKGTDWDNVTSSAMDASGNVYITGFFRSSSISFGSFTFTNTGTLSTDIFLVKYNSVGDIVWAKSFGGSSDESSSDITIDAFGSIYITGKFESSTLSFGIATLSNVSGGDIFLVKLNSAGNVIWAKNTGGNTIPPYSRGVSSVTTDGAGNVFITGFFDSSITFGSIRLTNGFGANIFTAKYDSSGSVLWAKKSIGAGGNRSSSIAVDASGNVYITGRFTSTAIAFDTHTLTGGSGYYIYLVKYNASGNVIWGYSVSDSDAIENTSLHLSATNTGSVFLSGEYNASKFTMGTTTLTNAAAGNDDIFLAKLDTAGNTIWLKGANGASEEYPTFITNDSYGNVYMTGTIEISPVTFGTKTLTNFGYFMVKYDNSGNVIWAKNDAVPNSVMPVSLNRDVFGNMYIAANFGDASLSLDTVTVGCISYPYTDVLIAKFTDGLAGINTINRSNDFSIYPNPASKELIVTSTQNIQNITIRNIFGVAVYNRNVNKNTLQIDISTLAEGLYFLTINNTETMKFMKQ